jgi:transcription antitermination factor NusG
MSCRDEEKVRESLERAVEMTFMNMAFVDVMITDEHLDLTYSHIIHITFSNPVAGGMTLYLPTECKKMIVENIHGTNWDTLTTDEIDDCLLELLNVLAGNFLNHYVGQERSHNMSFPQIMFGEEEIDGIENYMQYFFLAEGVPFSVGICVSS